MPAEQDGKIARNNSATDSKIDATPAAKSPQGVHRRLPAQSAVICVNAVTSHVKKQHSHARDKKDTGYDTAEPSQPITFASDLQPAAAAVGGRSAPTRADAHDLRQIASPTVNRSPERAASPLEPSLHRKSSQLGAASGVLPLHLTDNVYYPRQTSNHPPMQIETLPFPSIHRSTPRQGIASQHSHLLSLSPSPPRQGIAPQHTYSLSLTPPPLRRLGGISSPSHTPLQSRMEGITAPLAPTAPRVEGITTPSNNPPPQRQDDECPPPNNRPITDEPAPVSQEQHPPYQFGVDELALLTPRQLRFHGNISSATDTSVPDIPSCSPADTVSSVVPFVYP